MKVGPDVRAERIAVLPAREGFDRAGDELICRSCSARLRVVGVVDAQLMQHAADCGLDAVIRSFGKPVYLAIKPEVLS